MLPAAYPGNGGEADRIDLEGLRRASHSGLCSRGYGIITRNYPRFAIWTRIAGALAAIPFGAHGIAYLLSGSPPEGLLNAEDSLAYPVLIIAVIGWAVDVFRSTRVARTEDS